MPLSTAPLPQNEGARTAPEAILLLSGALTVYFAVRELVQLLQPCAPVLILLSKKWGGMCPS